MDTAGRGINYGEAEIELLFETVFRPLRFDPEVCKWMQDVLRSEHSEKSQEHRQQIAALRRRSEMLQSHIDKSYEDKLNGLLTQEEWQAKNHQWKRELTENKTKIDAFDDGKQDYIEKGVLLIELAQRTEHIYKNGNPETKRKLVAAVSSNHVLRTGTIEFDYRKPFDILAKSHPKEVWWTNSHNKQRPQPHEIIELPFSYKTNKVEKLAEFYGSGLSLGEIAKRTGIPKGAVRQTLMEGGVGVRTFRKNQKQSFNLTQVMRAGNTPYGTCYLDGKLVVDAREHQVVLNMYRMWLSGKSLRAIARTLNEQKIPTRFSKSWKHEVIKKIIERHEHDQKKVKGEKQWDSVNLSR